MYNYHHHKSISRFGQNDRPSIVAAPNCKSVPTRSTLAEQILSVFRGILQYTFEHTPAYGRRRQMQKITRLVCPIFLQTSGHKDPCATPLSNLFPKIINFQLCLVNPKLQQLSFWWKCPNTGRLHVCLSSPAVI